ncbi:hypothetical protein ONE63_005057 [Megalurothrips usitatus]|uniref:Uncharacterized protein n=1 Tax=Megalurothrips usitatus TaxID=439358 RepID=A0AAV7X1N1_9NEOP|nr:hypothetical protein ONE63_005057 [Megalurothrips usitatus]
MTTAEVTATAVPAPQQQRAVSSSSSPAPPVRPERQPENTSQSRIQQYCLKDDVTSAEVVWCLQAVENHVSVAATGRQARLFPRMFPDSTIAQRMELGPSKVGYCLTFGLGPCFFERVLNELRECNGFTVSFDESLNKKSKKLQMDLAVMFWSKTTNDVQWRYFNSAVLGHSRAADLSKALQEELKELNLTKMFQVSMDGPNVNHACLKELEKDIKAIHGADCSTFVNIGSCGLHTVNNSYKQGFKSVKWNLMPFLRGIYYVFKDVPARRSDYVRFSESGKPIFPEKFCGVRWLENDSVAITASKAIPDLQDYVNGVSREKIKVDSKSFDNMQRGLNDKLMPARLAFFAYIAQQLNPFLKEYQCSAPLIPFLYTDLSAVVRNIMSHFVKESVLDKAKSVSDVDISKEDNLLSGSKVEVGHAVKAELRKLNLSADAIKAFKTDCRSILIKMCSILILKSPVSEKYKLAKYVTFCDPAIIASQVSVSRARLGNALQAVIAKNWFSGEICDKISREFKTLVAKPEFIALCAQYRRSDLRVDHFWRNYLQGQNSYQNLYSFLKVVLVLSHGQAFVERGFSVNKEMIVENQLARSLVAQRHVYDAIKSHGGVDNMMVDKKMISAIRAARSSYSDALKKDKEDNASARDAATKRRSICDELAELKAKRAKLITIKAAEINAMDDQILSLTASLG